jgi:hypothetical protein
VQIATPSLGLTHSSDVPQAPSAGTVPLKTVRHTELVASIISQCAERMTAMHSPAACSSNATFGLLSASRRGDLELARHALSSYGMPTLGQQLESSVHHASTKSPRATGVAFASAPPASGVALLSDVVPPQPKAPAPTKSATSAPFRNRVRTIMSLD